MPISQCRQQLLPLVSPSLPVPKTSLFASLPAARGDLGKVQDMFYFLLAATCINSSSGLASFRLPKKSFLYDTVIIPKNLNNIPSESYHFKKLLFGTAGNLWKIFGSGNFGHQCAQLHTSTKGCIVPFPLSKQI